MAAFGLTQWKHKTRFATNIALVSGEPETEGNWVDKSTSIVMWLKLSYRLILWPSASASFSTSVIKVFQLYAAAHMQHVRTVVAVQEVKISLILQPVG